MILSRAMGPYRRAGLYIILFLIVLSTALSYLQEPRPSLAPASLWERFYYPIELNEDQRIFATDDVFWSVFASDDGRDVWAGSARGLIIHSRDQGATWQVLRPGDPRFIVESVLDLRFHGERGWATLWRPKRSSGLIVPRGTILYTWDGGKSWREPERIPPGVHSVFSFFGARHGWAGGAGGSIIHTADGGRTWKTQIAGKLRRSLGGIHFLDSRVGYAVGSNGLLLRTRNGGREWVEDKIDKGDELIFVRAFDDETVIAANRKGRVFLSQNDGRDWKLITRPGLKISGPIDAYSFMDKKRACAGGSNFHGFSSRDGGVTWSKSRKMLSRSFRAMHCSSSGLGWAVDGAVVYHTRDGGRSWRPQTSRGFSAVSFRDLRRRAALRSGRVFHSGNGGRSWRPLGAYFSQSKAPIFFKDENRGWAWNGGVNRTEDGGRTWSQAKQSFSVEAIFFADNFRGWTAGAKGRIMSSADGGITWRRRPSKTDADLNSIFFLSNGVKGWAAGDGIILRSGDGGAAWRKVLNINGRLRSIQFTDEKHGWAAGRNGILLQSTDGGLTWNRRESGTNRDITTVLFESRERGYLFNGNHLLRRTTDGGRTWFRPDWIVLPAPWYFLVFTWLAVSLILILRKRKPPFAESIANRPVSDRPLLARNEDRLNFMPLALGLSNFVRNENTIPPLTVAVTGEWGSGKSSLMNLVRQDLAVHRFDPVFFNAWHHQREEHLLAALLENIRLQAVPAWWRPRNWFFRARLFWIRTRDAWPVLALIGVAYAFVLGLFHESMGLPFGDGLFPGTVFDAKLWERGLGAGIASVAAALSANIGSLAFLGGNALVLGYLARMARAFGEHPAKLLAGLKGSFQIRDIKAKTGFRYRFAREFGDVTRALGNRKMVLFIDDLDRCRPENVVDVLETINFLAGSGECVIFLGLAMERVKKCVAAAFKELSGGEESPEAGEAFAEEYLKKLINIEVAVPHATSEQIEKLLDSDAVSTKPRKKPRKRLDLIGDWLRDAGRVLFHFAPAILTVLLIAATMAAVHQLGRLIGPTAGRSAEPGPIVSGKPAPTRAPSTRQRPPAAPGAELPANRGRFTSEYPQAVVPSALVVFAFLVILFLIRYVGRSREADIVRDNRDFVAAWKIWRRLVFQADAKPRAVKRFLNMVRLYAMRQRRSKPGLYPRERIGTMARILELPVVEVPDIEDGMIIPEDFLVALCAIQFYKPVYLEQPGELYLMFQDPTRVVLEENIMTECIREHVAYFKRRYLPESYIQRLKFYQDGVQLN